MKAYVATVHLILSADACGDASGAADWISETLRPLDSSGLVDWGNAVEGDNYAHAKAIDLPDEYKEGEFYAMLKESTP